MMTKWLAGCAALLVVAGCATTSPLRDPTPIATPSAFARADIAGASLAVCDTLAPRPAAEWLERVADDNLDLLGAIARVRQADALAAAARSPLWPRLDAQLETTRANTPFVPGAFIPRSGVATTWQGSLAASYELDVWGRVRHGSAAADFDAEAAHASLAALGLTLQAQALDAWFTAVAQLQLLGLLEQQTDTSGRFLELTRLRFGLGQVPAQDIGRQKQQLQSLEGQRRLTEAQAALAVSRLEALAGSVPGTHTLGIATLPAAPGIPNPGVPADVLARRPDVAAAWAVLAAADQRVAIAIAERLPALRLSASVLSVERTLGELFSDAFWSLGATLAGNIFDRGAQRSRIHLASARAEEALYDYADVLLRALREVHDALARNAGQDAFVASLEDQAGEARKVLLLTRDAYREGQVSYLEVLNALLSLQGLERQTVEAHRQQLANRIDLCRAAGVAPRAGRPT